GTCTRCIDHCPTAAILPDRVIDASKCISYYTIELRDTLLPGEAKGKMDGYLFGCDTCQDVCPWNRLAAPHHLKEFAPLPEILHYTNSDWEELTEESFKILFRDSPILRSQFKGIRRNLAFLQSPPEEEPD
ncbi:MAG: tRNA epoxyqueuosine(34) reductase QueG, partial [Bacteroidota bacterium]|nr:tRNA epoxyqueuosine(34) reductase QueG [Bacteroidota bacterium]